MQRFHKILFASSVGALCWLGMMAVHELGHVVAAVGSGGTVTRVVLHPLSISRTDVLPNPHPGLVVWSGPLVGSLLPLTLALLVSRKPSLLVRLLRFFAGFCLIANGAYISLGSFDQVGDCGEMLRTGSPVWLLRLFGLVTIPLGLALWHRLGSIGQFARDTSVVPGRLAYLSCGLLVCVLVWEFSLSLR